LGDRPLIVWSIDAAKNISEICDILVSTDDSITADICKKSGAHVPWLRPNSLATDTVTSVDVALHALDWYESENGVVDALLLLQPTSPFRSNSTIRLGIRLFEENEHRTVVGVSSVSQHPKWMFKKEGDYMTPYLLDHGLDARSQDLNPLWVVNGGFYLISPQNLRSQKAFIVDTLVPLFVESSEEALDIDTEWDFQLAEVIATRRNAI
jgi:CMP-N-acetylneuraminic acid synthetase